VTDPEEDLNKACNGVKLAMIQGSARPSHIPAALQLQVVCLSLLAVTLLVQAKRGEGIRQP
jgi:hypothetical protein